MENIERLDRQVIIKELGLNDLTPVQLVDGLYIKRDDLFRPFDDFGVNGGKLRQCCFLLANHVDEIQNGVITCCSIHSPQAPIVSAVCNYLGIDCEVFYGGTTEKRLKELPMPRLVSHYNGSIKIVNKFGHSSVLYSVAKKQRESTHQFIVDYGINLDTNFSALVESTADQVQNIPDHLDNLIVTCGSGITSCGILYGLMKHAKEVKNLILVGVAPDRQEKIRKFQEKCWFEFPDIMDQKITFVDRFHEKGFKYEKEEKASWGDIEFHPNYEAKAFKWIENNIYLNSKSLFWVVGAKPKCKDLK